MGSSLTASLSALIFLSAYLSGLGSLSTLSQL